MDAAFLSVVAARTAGDPMRTGVLWTNLSQRRIAAGLRERGFPISTTVVKGLLRRHRLGRRKARKTRAFKQHRHRDRQFRNIARLRASYENSANPVVSVDTKKKEFIGDLYREGRGYTNHTTEVLDHDFPSAARGVVYPHGIYDLKRNHGHLNLGLSHDTSRFACDSIAHWWQSQGRLHYPTADSILLLCDGGGSNAANRYVFKYHLQQLADRIGVEIRVAHYPAYTSKYNPIEHRFFPHVTRACQGVIFTSLDVAAATMAQTRTETGLRATVHVLAGEYPIAEKTPKEFKKSMPLVFDEELPKWNYRAIPKQFGNGGPSN